MNKKRTISKKSNSKSSIRVKVALLCTSFILVAVIINYLFLITASKSTITSNTENNMLDLATSYSQNVTNTVNQLSDSADFLMQSNAITSFISSGGTENKSEAENFISMFTNINTSDEEVNLVDANGIVLLSSNSDNIGKDLSKETYFSDMMSSGKSTQSDVFTSETSNESCITFAIPLKGGIPADSKMDTVPADGTGNEVPNSDMANATDSATKSNSTTDSSSTANSSSTTDQSSTADSSSTTTTDSAAGSSSTTTTDSAAGSSSTTTTSATGTQDAPESQEFTGAITTVVKVSALSSVLSDISVSNSKSSYAYLLDSTGTIIYHPTTDKIGTKVENSAINAIVNKLQAGNVPESDVISYTYDGVEKMASYSIDANNHWILVITSDKAEILSSLTSLTRLSFIISAIVILILAILAYLLSGSIANPIKKITLLINKTSDLDFTNDTSFDHLSNRRDETGEMSRSIQKMREVLHNMILQIGDASTNINNNASNLHNISNRVNDHASDNSATAEELSAGMEETSATTEVINTNIEQISASAQEITNKTLEGEKISTSLINRANDLKEESTETVSRTKHVFNEIKDRTDSAIEQSKAVEKINILTQTIKDIADQTSLLSLNASIEAARAGDAGRGFSIVASEIGSLATQSANTVSNINEIVNEVHMAVENMTKSLVQSLEFLEKNVLVDYQDFVKASEQYNSDAVTMNETMKSIYAQVDETSQAMQTISNSISEINVMINEASNGVSDVAEKNTNIVALTTQTNEMVEINTDYAKKLKEMVDKFKL